MTYAWIVSRIYRNHQYKLGILYGSAVYFTKPIFCFLIFGESITIAMDIISLAIIKVLYSCAKREGLYVSCLLYTSSPARCWKPRHCSSFKR